MKNIEPQLIGEITDGNSTSMVQSQGENTNINSWDIDIFIQGEDIETGTHGTQERPEEIHQTWNYKSSKEIEHEIVHDLYGENLHLWWHCCWRNKNSEI